MPNRCLYIATFTKFLDQERFAVLGALHNNYHGERLTTTDEAWMGETEQHQRDLLKNHILEVYGLSLIRLRTHESGEKEKIISALNTIVNS